MDRSDSQKAPGLPAQRPFRVNPKSESTQHLWSRHVVKEEATLCGRGLGRRRQQRCLVVPSGLSVLLQTLRPLSSQRGEVAVWSTGRGQFEERNPWAQVCKSYSCTIAQASATPWGVQIRPRRVDGLQSPGSSSTSHLKGSRPWSVECCETY